MPSQDYSEFQYQEDDYRNEGSSKKSYPQSQDKQTKKSFDPGGIYHANSDESPELNFDEEESEEESSEIFQITTTPSTLEPKPQAKAAPDPKTYAYMHYGITEETIEIDKTLFTCHPMHKCPTLCEYIKDCMLHCERTMHMLMCRPDAYQHARQIAIIQDCAEVCHLTTRQVARRSPVLRVTLRYCAKICRICAEQSMRYSDPESRASAKMCLHCAEVCEKFVQQHQW